MLVIGIALGLVILLAVVAEAGRLTSDNERLRSSNSSLRHQNADLHTKLENAHQNCYRQVNTLVIMGMEQTKDPVARELLSNIIRVLKP